MLVPNSRSPAGCFSPVVLLKGFMQEVGSALVTVTSLCLSVGDSGSSSVTAAVLWAALAVLACACPVLTTFSCLKGHLSTGFIRSLGKDCPLLTRLFLHTGSEDGSYLDGIVQLLPSTFANLHTLSVDSCQIASLPDMRANTSIRVLEVSCFEFTEEAEWLRLPTTLAYLHCFSVVAGPPTAALASQQPLRSLVSLTLEDALSTPLHSLAQILRAAPALRDVMCNASEYEAGLFPIMCWLGSSTAADLTLVHGRFDIELFRDATYICDCREVHDRGSLVQSVVAGLPCMTGAVRCELNCILLADAVALLHIFPDAEHVGLSCMEADSDDTVLRALSSCANITHLELCLCGKVTPMGLLALCMRVPQLRSVSHSCCAALAAPALKGFAERLRGYGSDVSIYLEP